jgi:RNA polymerase sigma-70 factor (ECF subfamily)
MAEYQAGSIDAFERLHDALAPDLKAYLTSLARDPTRADDLLQETFLQVHRSRAVHTPGHPVRPWVFAIAKRVFLMDRRSGVRRAQHERLSAANGGDMSNAVTAARRLHIRDQLESVLKQTPSDGRRAFVLHHFFGYSFKEIAVKLGITPGAAKIRSSRAGNFMRALLREKRDE